MSARNVDVSVNYILRTVDRGLRQAVGLTRDFSRETKTSTQAVDASLRANNRAWQETARIAGRAQRQVADETISSGTRVDRALEKQIANLRKAGVSYKDIASDAKQWGRSATETAAAIERSASKEVAAIDRIAAARQRLKHAMTLGLSGGSAGGRSRLGSEDRSLERGALGAVSSRVRLGATSLGGGLIGGIAGYLGVTAIKDAAVHTEELVKQAQRLHDFAGLSRKSAVEFSAVADAYGLSTSKLGMMFKALGSAVSTQLTKPTTTTKNEFKALGITTDELRKHQGDLQSILGIVADRLNKMPAGAEKTTVASKLLGRSWQDLSPLIAAGSKGMDDQLHSAQALAGELGGNSTKNALKLHEATIELKIAQQELEVEFTNHILPTLLKLVPVGIKVFDVLRKELGPAFHFVGSEVKDVSHWLGEHKTILHGVEVGATALVTAYAGLKVIGLVGRIVRGVGADFRTLKTGVQAVLGLFSKEESESVALVKAQTARAEANARLAASYDEVALAAKGAAGSEALAAEAGGAAGGLPGAPGAVGAAERGVAGSSSALTTAEEVAGGTAGLQTAEKVAQGAESEISRSGFFGMLLGREGATKITSRLSGLGSGLLKGAGIAGAGLIGSQLIGGMIGGKAGSTVSSIGSGASIGAGIGSIVPGVGTLLGGLGGGAIGGLVSALSGGPTLPDTWQAAIKAHPELARRFGYTGNIHQASGGFGLMMQGQGGDQAGARIIEAQKRSAQALTDIQKKINGASAGTVQTLQQHLDAVKKYGLLTKRQLGAAQGALDARGTQILQGRLGSTMHDIATSKYAPNSTEIFQRTTQDLAGLPAHMQVLGAMAMVKFDAGLEAKGKLAKGTTNQLIGDLETVYGPKLTAMLGKAGADSMQAFADSVQTSKVLGVVQGQIDGIHQKWSTLIPDTKVTTGNLVTVVSDDMNRLKTVISTSTGKQRDAALAAYGALKWNAERTLGSMVTTLGAQQAGLQKSIAGHSAKARDTASTNFFQMAQKIASAVGSGVEAMGAGVTQMANSLNSTLTAFGGSKVPGVLSVGKTTVQAIKTIQGFVSGKAHGGRVPGPVGPDNWTLIDPTGRPRARVGGAEILVANQHTEARVDGKLALGAAYGLWDPTTLDREVASETRMHTAARGARLPRAARGLARTGYAPTGSVVLDSGVNMSVGQEPTILSDLRRLASELRQTVYVISGYRSPAHSVAVGGFANDPHTTGSAADIGIGSPSRASMFGVSESQLRAVGLYRPYYPASAAEVNHVQLLAGGARGAGGASAVGAGVPQIKVPTVKGTGTMATLVRLGLGKLAAAANKKAQALTGGVSTAGLSGNLISIVRQIAGREGWGASQVSAWENVINRESGGSMTATNPSSGAYGIAQGITGPSWYAAHGGNATTMSGQLVAMANYIKQRYGTPTGAWAHEQSAGWYARGGRVRRALGGRVDPPGTIAQARARALAAMRAVNAPVTYAKPVKAPAGSAKGPWHRVGATIDPTSGQAPTYSAHGGYSFAELLQAGTNRGLHPTLTQVLGLGGGTYGMPMESTIMARMPGRGAGLKIWKNDVGSGQAGNAHYKVDLHQAIASALHWRPNQDIEVARASLGARLGHRIARTVGTDRPRGRHGPLLNHAAGMNDPRLRHYRMPPSPHGWVDTGDWVIQPGDPYTQLTSVGQVIGETPILTSSHDYGLFPHHPGHALEHRSRHFTHEIRTSLSAIRTTHDPGKFKVALASLGRELEHVDAIPYRHLVSLQHRLRHEIRHTTAFKHPEEVKRLEAELKKTQKGTDQAKRLAKELHTARESAAEEARLQAALKEVDVAARKRVSTLVRHAEGQAAALQGAQTRLDRIMTRRNIDPASGQGSRMLLRFDQHSVKVQRDTVESLRKAEHLAKRAHDPHEAAAIRAKLKAALDNLDQAVTDRITARRTLVENVAQAAVDDAAHRTTMADTRLQRLQIEQQINQTAGTPGGAQQIAAFIQSKILPALQDERNALKKQEAKAKSVGDTKLAKQIAEAIASKTNDIEQEKLDRLTAIRDATQATAQNTAELGGNLGVGYGGEQLPDLAGMLNGA